MRRQRQLSLGAILLLMTGAFPATARASSIVGDFSIAGNPNGEWTYGYTLTLGGTFIPYGTVGSPCDQWTQSVTFTPLLLHNGGGCSFYTATLPADVLLLHPGGSGEQSIVRWTAPASGTYDFEGLFEGLDGAGPTRSDVHILLNSNTGAQLFSDLVNDYLVSHPFSFSQSLALGDTID